ncbi:hypothetical protein LINPERHAP1_LOCUS41908, partial [Linum perenne]
MVMEFIITVKGKETSEHLLLFCSKLKGLCVKALPSVPMLAVGTSDLRWLMNIQASNYPGMTVNICYVMWIIWKTR